jgi:hypothetical protein
MFRLPLFLALFCVSAWAQPFLNLERVRGDAQGRTYLVFTASDVPVRTRGRFFPVVLRLTKTGELDPSFGRNGLIKLQDLEGWNQVGVKDLRFGSDGSLYVMGELSMLDQGLARPSPLGAEQMLTNLLVPNFDAGKVVTRKVFVSKFNPDGTPAVFGHDGTSLVHGILEHADDEAVGVGLDGTGVVAITSRVHRGLRKDEALVAMLTPNGEVKKDFGQKGLYRIPRPFTPKPSSFEDDFLTVRDPWFDGNKVRLFVNRSTFGRRNPARGDAEINYLIDLPVSGHATQIQVERLLGVGRATPLKEDEESFGTARAISSDGDSLYMTILPPSLASRNLHLLRYSMASGERMVSINSSTMPDLGQVHFRGMQAGDFGVDLFVQPRDSGALKRLSFDTDLVLRETVVLPEVTGAGMDYRECSKRILDLVGNPFSK